MENKLSLGILTSICLCLAACSKQSTEQKESHIQAQLGQAKHFDVPVPLSYKLASTSSKQQTDRATDFIRYNGTLSVQDTVSFYRREMERSGWDLIDLSNNQEGFLFCNKPTKQCGIQIRPNNNQSTALCLFITQRT